MTLKSKAIHAVKWSAAGALLRASIQYGQLATLARLLAPADFGVMAVVYAVVAYAGIFADAGLSSSLIHRAAVDNVVRSTVFWANVAAACCIAGLLAATAPLLASLFQSDQIYELALICAPSLVISAIGRQFEVAAEGTLSFRGLVLIESLASGVNALTAITLAVQGYGANSIAWGVLAGASTRCSLGWLVIARRWTPGLHFSWSAVQPHVHFGALLLTANLVNQFNSSIDVLIGGRLLGMNAIGLYSVPRQIILNIQGLINPVVTRVGFPLIAHVQHDAPRASAVYRRMVSAIALTNAPIYAVVATSRDEICGVLLGASWSDSAMLLVPLSAWGYLRSLQNPAGALLLGLGKAKLALYWNVALLAVYPAALVLGSRWNLMGMSMALLVVAAVALIPAWRWLIYPNTGWRLQSYLLQTLGPLIIATVCLQAAYAITEALESPWMRLFSTVVVGGIAYVFSIFKVYLVDS